MKARMLSNNGTQAEITLTLPGEVLGDLEKIALLNKIRAGDLVYSYIVDGLASDALAVKRMEFTDTTNRVPGTNITSMKTVEDLLKNLMY